MARKAINSPKQPNFIAEGEDFDGEMQRAHERQDARELLSLDGRHSQTEGLSSDDCYAT
jgi:hypothetical protein